MGGDQARLCVQNLRSWLPLFELLDGARFEVRHGAVSWTSATRLPLFNGVWGAPDPILDSTIDEVLAPFNEGDIPLLWVVPPPHEMTAQLEARGLAVEQLPGMTVELSSLSAMDPPPGVSITQVDDTRSQLEAATTISFTTNGFPPTATPTIIHLLDRMPRRERMRTFLATVDDVPAAAATLFTEAGVAGLYNVGTLPQFRGRGLGTLVSVAAMQAGRLDGSDLGVLMATAPGESIYRAIGFKECCRFTFASRGTASTSTSKA